MGKGHRKTDLDKARDELMSHVVRCEVLEAQMEHRMEWLDDTMDFMAERYPQLSDLQLAQLEMIGRRFLRPAIPHGADHNAMTRKKAGSAALTATAETEVEATDVESPEPAGAREAA